MEIQAAVVNEKAGNITIEKIELEEPKENEVLVKIVGTGICHTDLGVQHQHIQTPLPIVLGHEGAGIVEKVGPGVTEFEPGDHVVISFSYCGKCRSCLEGHPAACENLGRLNFGGRLQDGSTRLKKDGKDVATLFGQSSLATYAVSHVNNLVKVDKDVDLTILGPLACGIQTGAGTVLNKLKPAFGSSIAIFGCGGVGLSAVMAANLTPCLNIIAVDINDDRLALAKELGATHTINSKKADVVQEIYSITGSGVDYAVESTGVPEVVLQSIRSLKSRGIVAVVGVGGNTSIHIHDDLIPPNRTVVGVVEGDAIPKLFIPKLIEFYKKGKFPFDKMIKTYSFKNIDDAINDMNTGKTIKPVIIFNE